MAKRTPYLWRNVLINFFNSFRPKQIRGNLMGEDHLGNKYYEIPPDPSRGKRKPSRWFKPLGGESGFDQEMPAEWESWLRQRRAEPPTVEEIQKNLAIIEMKQKNGALLEAKAAAEREARGDMLPQDIKGMYSFPKYEEFSHSGQPKKK